MLVKLGVVIAGLLVLLYGVSDYWLSQQQVPSVVRSPLLLKGVAAVYSISPKSYSAREIRQTLKLGNLLASAALSEPSLGGKADGFAAGVRLLDRYLRSRPSSMDADAVGALVFESSLIMNRARALVYPNQIDRRPDILTQLESLSRTAADENDRAVAIRELMIARYLDRDLSSAADAAARLDSLSRHTLRAYDLYYKGLLGCVVEAPDGPTLLDGALDLFRSRDEVIYLVARNLDAPLIAVARERALCSAQVARLLNTIGRDLPRRDEH